MQAEETIIQNMNTMFWSNGAGNSGKDFFGLNALVGTGNDGPSSSDLGGIEQCTRSEPFSRLTGQTSR